MHAPPGEARKHGAASGSALSAGSAGLAIRCVAGLSAARRCFGSLVEPSHDEARIAKIAPRLNTRRIDLLRSIRYRNLAVGRGLATQ
jgi:hypothetical protein